MNIKTGVSVWCIAALLMVSYVAFLQLSKSLHIESNILQLLPKTQSDPAISRAFDSFSEINMRQLVFLVENTDLLLAKKGADQLAEVLTNSPWIDELSLKISNIEQNAIGQFNYNYRNHLLTLEDAQLLVDRQYDTFASDAMQRIFSPVTGALAGLISTDPFLLSYRFSSSMNARRSQSMGIDDGYLVSNLDGKYYVLVTASLAQSPFNQLQQDELLALVANVEKQWVNSGTLNRLIRTGAMFYAADGYETARSEVSVFGGSSLVLVLSLIIITFRSIKPLFLVSLAIAFGVGSGFIFVRLLFGEVHLLTFVFGASLIGVAVDYAFHYFAVDVEGKGTTRLSAIFPAISLGLLSSVIGYVALLATPFPGLQQMAIFCIAGLAGAYATVVLLFPAVKVNCSASRILLIICQRFVVLGASKPARITWLLALCLPVAAIGSIISNDFQRDDIREFQARDLELETQERTVQAVLDASAANQFYLVRGDTAEALLIELENAEVKLNSLVRAGIIDEYNSVSPWLASIDQQKKNYKLYRELYESSAADLLVNAGLITRAEFELARDSFLKDESNILTPQTWLASPLGEQLSYLWLGQIGELYFAVIALRNIHELSALENISSNIVFIDQVSTVNQLLMSYRESATILLLLAFATIFLVLSMRYGLRKAALVVSAPLIAVSTAILGLAMLGHSMNLFNGLALFLVIGIGIDFGIFFAEAKTPNPHTLMAVLLSALTTMFSFGMLSLSSTSVIQSFGLTTLIGIGTALLSAPVIGNLVTVQGEKQ